MIYTGSKRLLAKYIVPILKSARKPGQWYVEPFVGGANMLEHFDGPRIANDNNQYLIAMWRALTNGWQPPTNVSESEYYAIKQAQGNYPPELVAWVGITCSFGAKWFGSYARGGNFAGDRSQNYAQSAWNSVQRQLPKLQNVNWVCRDYNDLTMFPGSLIYCDPPYASVQHYKEKINHADFWQWCRIKVSEGHTLYVSEHQAPGDFQCVWEKEVTNNLKMAHLGKRVERLFTYVP